METKIFWTGIEYVYIEGSVEFGQLKGGFVYAFIKAFDVRDALDKLCIELRNRKLKSIEIEFVSPYDEDLEWETDKLTNHYIDMYREASNGTEIIFDDFHAYEQD